MSDASAAAAEHADDPHDNGDVPRLIKGSLNQLIAKSATPGTVELIRAAIEAVRADRACDLVKLGFDGPILLCVLVCGPFADDLRDSLPGATPALDGATNQLVDLLFVGDPHGIDPAVWKRYLKKQLRVIAAWPYPEFRSPPSPNERMSVARGERDLVTDYGIDPTLLPCIATWVRGVSDPLVVTLPPRVWATAERRHELGQLLLRELSEARIRQLFAAQSPEAEQPDGLRSAVRAHVSSLKDQVGALASAGLGRATRRPAPRAPSGWMWSADIERQFRVPGTSLHDLKRELRPDEDWVKDSDHGQVRYRLAALEPLLRGRGYIS